MAKIGETGVISARDCCPYGHNSWYLGCMEGGKPLINYFKGENNTNYNYSSYLYINLKLKQ